MGAVTPRGKGHNSPGTGSAGGSSAPPSSGGPPSLASPLSPDASGFNEAVAAAAAADTRAPWQPEPHTGVGAEPAGDGSASDGLWGDTGSGSDPAMDGDSDVATGSRFAGSG